MKKNHYMKSIQDRRIQLPDWSYDENARYCLIYCLFHCLQYYRLELPNINWNRQLFPKNIKSIEWSNILKSLKSKPVKDTGINENDFKKILTDYDKLIPISIKLITFGAETITYCLDNKLPPILIYHFPTLFPRTDYPVFVQHAGVLLGKKRNIYMLYDPYWNRECYEYSRSLFEEAWEKMGFKGYVFAQKRKIRKKITRNKPGSLKTMDDYV